MHFVSIGRPVARRGAREHALLRPVHGAGDQGQARQLHARRHARAPADLQQMAGQAEARHVGHGVHTLDLRQDAAHAVELGGVAQHLSVACGIEQALLQRRREHAHAQRLAQHQRITRLRVGVAPHAVRVHQAQAHQAVDGFEHVDGMPPGDGDARLAAHGRTAFEHPADDLGRQLGDGHAHQGQRQDGRAAHGVDVRQRIRRGDTTEVAGVVDDGGEEVRGGHQRLLVVQAVDGGIVAGFRTHQQFGRDQALRRACQNLAQQARRNFAAAPTAMGELGELDGFFDYGCGVGHGGGHCASRAGSPPLSTGVLP